MTRTAPPRTTRRPTSGPDSALDSEGTARTLDGGPGAIHDDDRAVVLAPAHPAHRLEQQRRADAGVQAREHGRSVPALRAVERLMEQPAARGVVLAHRDGSLPADDPAQRRDDLLGGRDALADVLDHPRVVGAVALPVTLVELAVEA